LKVGEGQNEAYAFQPNYWTEKFELGLKKKRKKNKKYGLRLLFFFFL